MLPYKISRPGLLTRQTYSVNYTADSISSEGRGCKLQVCTLVCSASSELDASLNMQLFREMIVYLHILWIHSCAAFRMIELAVLMKLNFHKLIILVYLHYLLEKYKSRFITSNNILKSGTDTNTLRAVSQQPYPLSARG